MRGFLRRVLGPILGSPSWLWGTDRICCWESRSSGRHGGFCIVLLEFARPRSRGFLPGQLSTRPHDTFPCVLAPAIHNSPFLPRVRGMWEETVAAHAAGFANRSEARHCCKPNRIHSRLGPQVRLGLLSTPSRDDDCGRRREFRMERVV